MNNYSHENTPFGYKPCTREEEHDGPCALHLDLQEIKEACPDCTDYRRAYGKGGWYETRWLFGVYNFIPIGKKWVECKTCEGKGRIYH
jgi:hypothetical protein